MLRLVYNVLLFSLWVIFNLLASQVCARVTQATFNFRILTVIQSYNELVLIGFLLKLVIILQFLQLKSKSYSL
jgi:hypothetical protein